VSRVIHSTIVHVRAIDADAVTMVTWHAQLRRRRWTWLRGRTHRAWYGWRGVRRLSLGVHWQTLSTWLSGTHSTLTAAGLRVASRPAVDSTMSFQGHYHHDTLITCSRFSCPVYSHLAHTTSGSDISSLFSFFLRVLSLWCPLLPHGYSYKVSCARPG